MEGNPSGEVDLRPQVAMYRPGVRLGPGAHEVVQGGGGLGSVFLGSHVCSAEAMLSELQENGVAGIVNCTRNYPCVHRGFLEYSCVTVDDLASQRILPYLEGAARFIHGIVQSGKSVLVHCEMGVSRSATVVIAYLVQYHGLTRNEAYIHVKTRRHVANPNQGFWLQLLEFEAQLRHMDDAVPTVDFNGDWATRSCAMFGTCGDALVGQPPYSPELAEAALEAALSHMFSHGVKIEDGPWLAGLCASFLPVDATSVARRKLHRESPLMKNWGSDISPTALQRLLDHLVSE